VLGLGLGLSLKTCLKSLAFDDEVLGLGLGLVIKSLALMDWPCQFVLKILHQADSQVIVSSQCMSGNVA